MSSCDLNFLFEGSVKGDSVGPFHFFFPPELDLSVVSGLRMECSQFWRAAEKQVSVVTCALCGSVTKVLKLLCLRDAQFCHSWVIALLLVFVSVCLSVWATSWMWPGRLTTSSRSPSLTWTSEFTMWKLPTCSLTGKTLTASSMLQGCFGFGLFFFKLHEGNVHILCFSLTHRF